MTEDKKKEITKISQEFAEPFYKIFGGINNSGFLIVDPLSGYLNLVGYKNTLQEIPANDKHCQVLIMAFKDGSKFIPAGADLKQNGAENWMWL